MGNDTKEVTSVGVLGRMIRRQRRTMKMSIAQLALMADVSPRLLSELERGRENVSADRLMRLLVLVNVQLHATIA